MTWCRAQNTNQDKVTHCRPWQSVSSTPSFHIVISLLFMRRTEIKTIKGDNFCVSSAMASRYSTHDIEHTLDQSKKPRHLPCVCVFSSLANQTQLGKATYVHCGERFKDEGERFFCLLPNQCRLSSSKLQHAFMLMRREKSKDVYVLRWKTRLQMNLIELTVTEVNILLFRDSGQD